MASAWTVTCWRVVIWTRNTVLQLHKNNLYWHIPCTVRIKRTAEFRQGQKTRLTQSGEYTMAKNALVFGILVNWYFSQDADPLFVSKSENSTLNYTTKRWKSNNFEWQITQLYTYQGKWSFRYIYGVIGVVVTSVFAYVLA